MTLAALIAAGPKASSGGGGFDWTAFGTIVALVGLILSNVWTWRGQKQDKQLSESSAQRSEAAASLTADNSARIVEALEKIAAGGPADGGPVALPSRVKWSLRYDSGDRYVLENVGDARAHGVTISSHESMQLVNIVGGPDVNPGEAMTFIAALSLGTRDHTITVTWTGDDGTPQRWRYPLPGKPR